MKRNSAIEIYRVLLMLGIVVIHQYSYVGWGHHWIPRLLTSCVVGFVFISGYYGVRLSMGKLAKVYGVALFCAVWFGIHVAIVGEGGGIRAIIDHLRVWWFVNAYIMLMLFSPLINQALTTCENRRGLLRVALPVLFVVFIWSFLCIVPGIKEIMPGDRSFGTHNGVTLIGIYIGARLFRLLQLEEKLPRWGWGLVWVVSGFFCACNLGKYNSPFALTFAAASFTLFKQLGESKFYHYLKGLGAVCLFLGPSMLSVYLLHVGGVVTFLGFGTLTTEPCFEALCEKGLAPTAALWAVIILSFVACVGIDLLRRAGLWVVRIGFNRGNRVE